MFDAFSRTGMEFFLVKQTARYAINEDELQNNRVDIGVRRMEWNNDAKDMLFVYFDQEHIEKTSELPNSLSFMYKDVPFTIHIYEENKYLSELITLSYEHEFWMIPNQFETFDKETS